jgi:hypothetical protein
VSTCSRSSISGRLTSKRVAQHVLELHALPAQRELVARRSARRRAVVHEPDHLQGLSLDHRYGGLRRGGERSDPLQHFHGVADRREPVAQLVREDREELVLGPVGLALRLARALLERDVARDLRRTDHPAAFVVDRRDRERDVDAATALRDPLGLEVPDARTGADPREDRVLLARALGRMISRIDCPIASSAL